MTPQEPTKLKNIETDGTYVLKLFRPADDEKKAKRYSSYVSVNDGKTYARASLFFMDGNNNCLTVSYSMEWEGNRKALAIVVGKFSGKFCPSPPESITADNLYCFVEPAFNQIATVELVATPAKDKDGNPKIYHNKPQFNYKFTKISGPASAERAIYKPAAETKAEADPFASAPDSGSVPF